MKKIKLSDLSQIHIELSSFCNLKCSFCGRQTKPSDKRMNKNLSTTAIDNLFIDGFVERIERITICGNYGEPTLNKNIFYLLDELYKKNPNCPVWISTNGSTHNKNWWKIFGRFVKNKNVKVCFCLDGLSEETNKYRGTSPKIVIENMDSYISGGGKAEWKTVVFKHNENEIQRMRLFAKEKNMYFFLKNSWQYNEDFQKPTKYNIDVETLHNPYCRFLKEGFFYVASTGEIFPCCYGVPEFYKHKHLSLEDHRLDDIINDTNFQVLLLYVDKRSQCRIHCDES